MTDGLTDRKRRTILIFLVNCQRGTVFFKSIDASNICKTTEKTVLGLVHIACYISFDTLYLI